MMACPADSSHLCECPDCGLFVRVAPLPRRALARCPRCGAVLARHRANPETRTLALALTALMLLGIAATSPFLALDAAGLVRESRLLSGPEVLAERGFSALALVVLATTVLVPLARLAALAVVLIGVRLHLLEGQWGGAQWWGRRLSRRVLVHLLAWVERLSPWAMVEVFLLGTFVAYTKLVDLAEVSLGPALYALGALMLASAAADAACDREALWRTLVPAASLPVSGGKLIGCDVCGLVCDAPEGSACPRCGSRLRRRKPAPLARTVALLLAAAILYLPANILPVMTVVRFGQSGTHTILSGVEELIADDMWPLALLVFFASITVPVLKLVGLTGLVVVTHRRSRRGLRERTVLFRIVDAIGRWSMIDVFMVSILVAIVQLGAIATIFPGPGVVAFCGVVILTMLAAESFDPRLMWDDRA
mgnify:CR=1 FL=1